MIVSAVLIDAWVTGQTRPRKQPETHGPCECAGLEQNLAGVDLPACETEKSEVTGRDLVLLTISPRSGHESRNYGASVCRRRQTTRSNHQTAPVALRGIGRARS